MHSQLVLTDHASLNLAQLILQHPVCKSGCRLIWWGWCSLVRCSLFRVTDNTTARDVEATTLLLPLAKDKYAYGALLAKRALTAVTLRVRISQRHILAIMMANMTAVTTVGRPHGFTLNSNWTLDYWQMLKVARTLEYSLKNWNEELLWGKRCPFGHYT